MPKQHDEGLTLYMSAMQNTEQQQFDNYTKNYKYQSVRLANHSYKSF